MSKERELLVRIYRFLESDVENDFGLGSDIRELLTHPEPIKEREVSGKIISTDDSCNWNLTVGGLKDYDHVYVNGIRYTEYQPDINTQYLLDQVSRLTAENAMIKEKWSEAQPEPTSEPVAWMVETRFNNEPIKEIHTVKPMERVYKYCIVTELYSAPLKPLTGIEISNGFKADDEAIHPYSYWAGVDFAEKHHGIGGGE